LVRAFREVLKRRALSENLTLRHIYDEEARGYIMSENISAENIISENIFMKIILSEKYFNRNVFYPKIIKYESKIHKKYFIRKYYTRK